jgi:carbon storage regulator
MLVLTRKPRQQIMIGDDIVINVVEVQGENVRLAIDAPREIKIYRGEIYRAIQEENQKAAAPAPQNLDFSLVMPPRGSDKD